MDGIFKLVANEGPANGPVLRQRTISRSRFRHLRHLRVPQNYRNKLLQFAVTFGRLLSLCVVHSEFRVHLTVIVV